jgi:alkaline phosphatase
MSPEIYPTYPQYKWLPESLANVSYSSDHLAILLSKHITSSAIATLPDKDLRQYISETLVKKGLGIYDADDGEIQLVLDNLEEADYIFADMVSRRAQIGWSTHGHSAVDVNIYGSAGSEALRGNHENTDIGEFLRNYLEVDLDAITKELREKLHGSGVTASAHLAIEKSAGKSSDRYHHFRADGIFTTH